MNENTTVLPAPARGVHHQSAMRSSPVSTDYNVALGYLRAFLIMLVVAHHAVLAFHPFAPPPPASLVTQPRFWQAFPVVDASRSAFFAWFVGFNDTFFMALMFFLSGLFVGPSIKRKGTAGFLRSRFLRLGIPFLVAVLLSPLAYFPAYLQSTAKPAMVDFWQQWRALGNWPLGPAWFLSVLLAFDCVAAALFSCWPRWAEALRARRPATCRGATEFFFMLVGLSTLAYVPMVLKFGSFHWTSFGPFTFQTSRILHYGIYFVAGILLGAPTVQRNFLEPKGGLAQRWPVWVAGALGAFVLSAAIVILVLSNPAKAQTWELLGSFAFVISCATSCLAFLSLFLRFAAARKTVCDNLGRNAYGIYLLHYAFVTWVQYSLLRLALPALAKGALAFLCAFALSWGASNLLRRIPAAAKVI